MTYISQHLSAVRYYRLMNKCKNLTFGVEHPSLAIFPSETRQACIYAGKPIHLDKRSVLFQAGMAATHFYILIEGALKLIQHLNSNAATNKTDTITEILRPGDTLGINLMLNDKVENYPYTAKPLGTALVLELNKEFFENHWTPHTELMTYSYSQINKSLDNIRKDRCLQWLSLEQKIAYLLSERLCSLGKVKITRKELAEYIGSTQASVIRIISQWSKNKLIQADNQEITILSPEKLKSLWNH